MRISTPILASLLILVSSAWLPSLASAGPQHLAPVHPYHLQWMDRKIDQDFEELAPYKQCILGATSHFRLHPALVLAILKTEGGKPGLVNTNNRNGTADYGPMQVNDIWIDDLQAAGFAATPEVLTHDVCFNVYVGTWILANEIFTAGEFWHGVGNYNTGHDGHKRKPESHRRYVERVHRHWTRLVKEAG